jgi:RNA polymerase sigma factor (sigma-70 family)
MWIMMEAVLAHELEQTYRRERPRLLTLIRSRIADPEEAEDILQEVFSQAVRNLNAGEVIDNLLGWLYTAARNRIIDWYRRRKPVSLQKEAGTESSLEELLADTGVPMEKRFSRSLVIEALIDSIEDLPETQRQVVIMQAIEDRTFKEISELTGTSINTLIARKRYALRFLRQRLAAVEEMVAEISAET